MRTRPPPRRGAQGVRCRSRATEQTRRVAAVPSSNIIRRMRLGDAMLDTSPHCDMLPCAMSVLMELNKIIIRELGESQIIVLGEVNGQRKFPIVIGLEVARAIDRRLKGQLAE